LELGWARCGRDGLIASIRSYWIVPRTGRPVRRAVRELTGWTEACLAEALDERAAWTELGEDIAAVPRSSSHSPIPTVIHFARFELAFLRDLHERLGDGGGFPFDAICLHQVATLLFPDLPRRNIRALAGFLGHSPELVRRSGGHVDATLFIWRALVPALEERGVATWAGLKKWLEEAAPSARRTRRVFPYPVERRRALPRGPGVYRFVRRNGDILYVGKATSLRARVTGHFKSRGPATERGLELLSQVHEVVYTETPTLLEAALLESDEIKRVDPPYNVQLRTGDRRAWFASNDFRNAVPVADALHRIGPLPSERALLPLSALIALAGGAHPSKGLCASALAVPAVFLPEEALFIEGFRVFSAEHIRGDGVPTPRLVTEASVALWLARGRAEESSSEDSAPDVWDLARVKRRLERSLVQTGLLVRRARALCLLADATIVFREHGSAVARRLTLSNGQVVDRADADVASEVHRPTARRPGPLRDRRCAFDAPTYDRLRVLLTEIRRIQDENGDLALTVGSHFFDKQRLLALLRGV
jgi:DNA polymerase-3 subunit epsilon